MIYNTIDQMRPAQIIQFIHGRVLEARVEDLRLLGATRRACRSGWTVVASVRSRESGYVVGIDLARITKVVERHAKGEVEIEFDIAIGSYRAVQDPVFRVTCVPGVTLDSEAHTFIVDETLAALDYDDGRNLKRDAAYGLHQLAIIAWTSVSTSKSNPSPGISVIQALRDIISQWSDGETEASEEAMSCIVYHDATPTIATDVLEAVIVAASESIQSQTLSEAVTTIAILLCHVDQLTAERLAEVARRALSSLGEHVLTRQLEAALADLSEALNVREFNIVSSAVSDSTAALAASLGQLNSRSTRVPRTTS